MSPSQWPRHPPDPVRAHGAWVYLGVSVLAGTASVGQAGMLRAVLAGTGYAGLFLLVSAVAVPGRRRAARLASGLALAALAPPGALALGASPNFLAYALVAAFPAGLAVAFALRRGFLSPPALAFAVSTLSVAAPCAARAGGATPQQAWILQGMLLPFFVWRTWTVRSRLDGQSGWSRARLRAAGLREAGYALGWGALALVAARLAA
jgi:hypothetical protein